MSKKPQKFRPNENTSSISFTQKLNALVDSVNRANNIKVNVKGGTGGILHYPKGHGIFVNLPKKSISKGGGGGGTNSTLNYFWGVIVTPLQYADASEDGQCYYEIVRKDEYDEWLLHETNPSSPEVDTYIPKLIQNYNIDGETVSSDLREFVPWLLEGEIVPIIWDTENTSGEDEDIDYANLYFLNTFSYTGDNETKSVAWNEDVGRIMSVYK